jgi:hypothetical protein
LKEPKLAEKEAFLKTMNGVLNYLYGEHLLKKRGFCFLYSNKSSLNPSEKQELGKFSPYLTLQLNKKDN